MNSFVRLIKSNLIPSIVFAALVFGCCCAWYYFHPASPHFKKYTFVVAYDAIGTLSPGNRVEVRGISRGEIAKVELTDDAVYVTARVLVGTDIPVNSEFRLINSGLMGEREMCILTGDGRQLVQEGDTVVGHYDEGTTGVALALAAALEDVGEIKDTLKAFVDSITVGESGKRIQRVIKKGKNLVNVGKSDVQSWMGDVEKLLGDLDGALNKVKSTLEGVADKAGPKVDEVQAMLARVDSLLLKLNELKEQGANLTVKLSQDDNTAGLILNADSPFGKEVDKIILDTDALISHIKQHGIRLNIDIF